MKRLKEQREKDADELATLRRENVELRSLNKTWNPLDDKVSSQCVPTPADPPKSKKTKPLPPPPPFFHAESAPMTGSVPYKQYSLPVQFSVILDAKNRLEVKGRDMRHRDEGRAEGNVRRERSRSAERAREGQRLGPKKMINTIAGGFAGKGASSSTQRQHLCAGHSLEKLKGFQGMRHDIIEDVIKEHD
ncbi:hypothetical protein Fmac_018179 [Flemingia macrophylla]|uniref:Uncharacterized protein n=1 Tax=Flemingia macrophylla TaxID=520843 RepID=A0ABD1M497_9FABA